MYLTFPMTKIVKKTFKQAFFRKTFKRFTLIVVFCVDYQCLPIILARRFFCLTFSIWRPVASDLTMNPIISLLFDGILIVLSAGVAEQLRPEKPCPLESLLVLPFADEFRVAAQQDFGNLPAFVVGRSRVNRR